MPRHMHFTQPNGQVKKEMMHFRRNFYIANQDEFSNRRAAALLGLFVTDTIFYLHIENNTLIKWEKKKKNYRRFDLLYSF